MDNRLAGDLSHRSVHVTSFFFDKEVDGSPMLAAEQDEQYFVDICQHNFINWNICIQICSNQQVGIDSG